MPYERQVRPLIRIRSSQPHNQNGQLFFVRDIYDELPSRRQYNPCREISYKMYENRVS